MSPRDDTRPGGLPAAEAGDWNLTPSAIREIRKMVKRRNSRMPEWAKWLLLVGSGAVGGSGGVWAMVPFETKATHAADVNALKTDIAAVKEKVDGLPQAVLNALEARDAARGRRR